MEELEPAALVAYQLEETTMVEKAGNNNWMASRIKGQLKCRARIYRMLLVCQIKIQML